MNENILVVLELKKLEKKRVIKWVISVYVIIEKRVRYKILLCQL